MDKQNLETITMGKGSSMPCLKEAQFFEYQTSLTVKHKRNKSRAGGFLMGGFRLLFLMLADEFSKCFSK